MATIATTPCTYRILPPNQLRVPRISSSVDFVVALSFLAVLFGAFFALSVAGGTGVAAMGAGGADGTAAISPASTGGVAGGGVAACAGGGGVTGCAGAAAGG